MTLFAWDLLQKKNLPLLRSKFPQTLEFGSSLVRGRTNLAFSFSCHIDSFYLETATQLVNYPYGDGIEVILAGGRREFMSNNTRDPEYVNKTGDRQDGRDLTQEWVNKHSNSTYVWNKEEFDKIDPEKVDKVLGKRCTYKLHKEDSLKEYC